MALDKIERDNKWLKQKLISIWQRYYPEINQANNVFIKFGRPCRTRLGSIKLGRRLQDPNTIITINGFFKDETIPEFVIEAVIAHELTHYAQGFCSPHEQKHRFPHRGGVLKNEMIDRGLEDLLKLEKQWIKLNWTNYLKKQYFKPFLW
jgi:hypothetical protein